MTYKPTEVDRDRLITDLHGLADFLASHPELPVPKYGPVSIRVHPRYDTDAATEEEAIAEVERIAALLGVPTRVEYGQHVACVDFGTVAYEAILVTRAARDRRYAQDSYRDSISADPPSEA
ncbi:hypothetical protein E1267_39845 [Nonomuraea longispora]|uniref:Uncharacterized protein n=1 Tax=Nonomuraea longispora TaxID=1848320 RepID=A0A4R4MN97_9ACTN|nr:hypothetical protein [Nonomuraea longispora]TDB97424.1 hypothetical protein E1267_39845 [Nonomuraea longispora]